MLDYNGKINLHMSESIQLNIDGVDIGDVSSSMAATIGS